MTYSPWHDTREQHETLSQLALELRELEGEHAKRLADAEGFLARVEAYLTHRCDVAYVAYYRANSADRAGMVFGDRAGRDCAQAIDTWQDLGDARELIRQPLREMRGAKLKGRRVVDGRILL